MKQFVIFLLALSSIRQASAQTSAEHELTGIIHDWYNSINKGELGHLSDLLTDDFQLIAFGDRFDNKEVLGLVKDYSEVAYTLNKVGYGSDVSFGFIICEVELNYKFQGMPIMGKASEVYIFKKVGERWKIDSKTMVMM